MNRQAWYKLPNNMVRQCLSYLEISDIEWEKTKSETIEKGRKTYADDHDEHVDPHWYVGVDDVEGEPAARSLVDPCGVPLEAKVDCCSVVSEGWQPQTDGRHARILQDQLKGKQFNLIETVLV